MLTLKYLKHVCFLDPTVTLAAPALPLWRAKLPWNVMGTDEYYNVYTHQAKLSKCFEKMDYLRPGQTCSACIIPILKWRGDNCLRSVREARAELGGMTLPCPSHWCVPVLEVSFQLPSPAPPVTNIPSQCKGGWQPFSSLLKWLGWETKPLRFSRGIPVWWAQSVWEGPRELCRVRGMSGYRKVERFSP